MSSTTSTELSPVLEFVEFFGNYYETSSALQQGYFPVTYADFLWIVQWFPQWVMLHNFVALKAVNKVSSCTLLCFVEVLIRLVDFFIN